MRVEKSAVLKVTVSVQKGDKVYEMLHLLCARVGVFLRGQLECFSRFYV